MCFAVYCRRSSITRFHRNGESTPPCGHPRLVLIRLVAFLCVMVTCRLVTMFLIQPAVDESRGDWSIAICWISRNLLERDSVILTHIYKTIIRPKLEYCVQLWNPEACHGNWSTILELVLIQRRFTRLANDIGLLPYSDRLVKMKLTTLGERRIRGDLIETFKIVNGIVEQ